MQCVILAGGLGTRMRPLTEGCPKTLLPVHGRPFAYHQMYWLAAQDVTDVVYCIGHQGEMIRRYWEAEHSPIEHLRYVDEGACLRGTGGALRLAYDQGALDESFFVMYGDSFLPVAFAPVWDAFEASGQPALMTVLHNDGRWDRSNVIYKDGHIVLYDKSGSAAMHHIDYGLLAFRREALADQPDVFDLAGLLHSLSREGRLAGFEVEKRFYEVGSVAGLRDLEHFLQETDATVTF